MVWTHSKGTGMFTEEEMDMGGIKAYTVFISISDPTCMTIETSWNDEAMNKSYKCRNDKVMNKFYKL